MQFFKGYRSNYIYNEILLQADSQDTWKEITDVMVNRFRFPLFLRILGVPEPLSAKVIRPGVGGYRIAYFSNGAQFQQEILEWDEHKKYRFKFSATKNFKVGHVMNLSQGPLEIRTGGYELYKQKDGLQLVLSSNYALNGFFGRILHLPFRLVIYYFQKYLLKAIKSNLSSKA